MVPEHLRRKMGPCCFCGASIAPDSFRDRESYLMARQTSLCQGCLDMVYLATGPDDLRAYPIHDGALVAVRAPGHVAELSVLPFRFVVPGAGRARVAWEARFISRAGPYQERLDPRCELEPMRELLSGHQVCVSAYSDFRDPRVVAVIDVLDLLIGLDARAFESLDRVVGLPAGLPLVSFSDEVPWTADFGRALRPLGTWWCPEPGPRSTLRECALMASLLLERGGHGLRPLDYVLACRREPFEEQSDA